MKEEKKEGKGFAFGDGSVPKLLIAQFVESMEKVYEKQFDSDKDGKCPWYLVPGVQSLCEKICIIFEHENPHDRFCRLVIALTQFYLQQVKLAGHSGEIDGDLSLGIKACVQIAHIISLNPKFADAMLEVHEKAVFTHELPTEVHKIQEKDRQKKLLRGAMRELGRQLEEVAKEQGIDLSE